MNSRTFVTSLLTWLTVDKRLAIRSANDYLGIIRRFFESTNAKTSDDLTVDLVRSYLGQHVGDAENTYANRLKALRKLFEFLGDSKTMESFVFPSITYGPIEIPSKSDVARFYEELPNTISKAIYLFLASSGLRLNEIMTLRFADVNFQTRMLTPNELAHQTSRTKKSYFSFYNVEAENILNRYQSERGKDDDTRLFNVSDGYFQDRMCETSKKIGIHITAKSLRAFFCEQIGECGLAERYIDLLCGRTAKSVFARHYSDFKPEKMQARYEKAGLKILS